METASNQLRLTRAQLYDRVWATPIIRLAEEFGVTNFLLAGICRKHDIPTPPSGYWSRVAHNKSTARPALEGDGELVVDVGKFRIPGYRASRPTPSSQSQRSRSAPTEAVARPGEVRTHAKVAKTLSRLRAGKGEGFISVVGAGCFRVRATAVMADRIERVLQQLVEQLEGRGGRVRATDNRLELEFEGEAIGFELVELTDRIAHKVTDAERAAQEKYRARLAQAQRTGAYVSPWDAPKIADWDHVPNGKLSLVLDETARYRGVRRTFSDRKTQRVETLVDCVVEAIVGFAAETKRRRIEAEEARKQAERDRQQREALKQLAVIEARRVEFADRQIARLETVERMTKLLRHLGDGELPDDTGRFRAWLGRYVGQIQADLEPGRIEARLASTRLMHDDAVTHAWIDVETGGYRSSV